MEDAMILNKSSYERGFAHGSIVKSEVSFVASGTLLFSLWFLFVYKRLPNV